MEKTYYHPARTKKKHIPVYCNSNQYDAITYFLRVIEKVVPDVSNDLKKILPIYEKVRIDCIERGKDIDSFEWKDYLEISETINPELTELRNALCEWAITYNLSDKEFNNTIFLEIGLWALHGLFTHDDDVKEDIQFYKDLGKEPPKDIFRWSFKDYIYFDHDLEDDNLELYRSVENKDSKYVVDLFSIKFPFVFAPRSDNPLFNLKNSLFKDCFSIRGDIESLYEHDDMKGSIIKALMQGKPGIKEDLINHLTQPWEGMNWDPRQTTWIEFERELDEAFEIYKKAYKERMETFLKENGYVLAKEKRNLIHFHWLVRFQIQQWKLHDITAFYSTEDKTINEDTVSKAIRDTAKLIGISLRTDNK